MLCLVIVLSGCSGGAEEPAPEPTGASSPTGSTATPSAAPRVRTTTEVGEVVGRLPKARRKVVSRHLTRVVDRWWQAAYLSGDYPRSKFGPAAFPGFSPGATRRARHDRDLMSNAAIGSRIESVTAKRRRVALDLLAVDGRVKVATARVSLVFRTTRTSGEKSRPEAVRGRLFITREPAGWRVIGYDVSRGAPRVAEDKAGEKAQEKSGNKGKQGRDKSRDKGRDKKASGTGKDGNR
jgi:hypothetical protein